MADPVTLTVLSLVGAATSAAGTIMGGSAAADAGARTKSALDFRAKQDEQAAAESRAVSQRSAIDKRREGALFGSKLQARAAASGGGADDPTILDLGGDIAARSEYDALFEMYKGENRARGYEDSAAAARMSGDAAMAEGEAKKRASYLSAGGTIIGAAGSAYRRYKGIDDYGDGLDGYGSPYRKR